MESSKVKLPKEVAKAIEGYRKIGGSNEDIMRMRFGSVLDKDEVFRKIDFDELLNALVNGYVVEQTPEDKVREYLTGLVRMRDNKDRHPDDSKLDHSAISGALQVLKFLNIKIEGVNDHENN